MKTLVGVILVALFVLPAGDASARRRAHVVVVKPYYRPAHPIVTVPVAVIPPLALFYDLARRTDCRGDVLGMGGPGFDSPITPATGNVMIPAVNRAECQAAPR
jgi:hypothetical protein